MKAPFVLLPKTDPDVDNMAAQLARLGALGRSMPPSWDGAGITHFVASPDGDYSGKLLPGRGFYLPYDLKAYGIRRPIPNVYPRSPVKKLIEGLGGDEVAAIRVFDTLARIAGAAISTYDGIISARANGKAFDVVVSKASITTVANNYSSLFAADGQPTIGTYTNIPGGAAHSRSSTGAWSVGLADPGGSDLKYLLTLGFTSAQQINMAILVDLLVAAGNITANSAAAQTINTTALTRYTSGAGVMMTFVVTTTLGAGAHNMTVNKYHNQAGTANQTTAAETGTSAIRQDRLAPVALGPFMKLAAGDYGVQSVEEYTQSAAITPGAWAINLYFPLAFVPGVASGAYIERDSTIQIDGLTELVQTAGGVLGCLTMYILANTTSSGILTAFMRTCDG